MSVSRTRASIGSSRAVETLHDLARARFRDSIAAAIIASLSLVHANKVVAQNLMCGNARPLLDNSGHQISLERGRSHLTHYWDGNRMVPLFVYLTRHQAQTTGAAGYDVVHIKEGGADGILSTTSPLGGDNEFTLNVVSPALASFVAPIVESFDAFDRYLVLGVSDGLRCLQVPISTLQPTELIAIEFNAHVPPGNEVARETVVASYTPRPATSVTSNAYFRIASIHIDHEVDVRTQVPLVAWNVTTDQSHVGSLDDDTYYCRLNQCDPAIPGGGPIATGVFPPYRNQWYGMSGGWVTEAFLDPVTLGSDTTIMVTAKPRLGSNQPPVVGSDIYAMDLNHSNGTPSAWFNSPSVVGTLSSLRASLVAYNNQFGGGLPLVLYLAQNISGLDRLDMIIQSQASPSSGGVPVFTNDPNGTVDSDYNLQFGSVRGMSIATFSAYPSIGETYLMWNHGGAEIRISGINGNSKAEVADLDIASISSLLAGQAPSIQSFANLVPQTLVPGSSPPRVQRFVYYGEAVSQNTFIVTAVPDPRQAGPGFVAYYNQFVDADGRILAWAFACAQ
jgi:hypothetical protein